MEKPVGGSSSGMGTDRLIDLVGKLYKDLAEMMKKVDGKVDVALLLQVQNASMLASMTNEATSSTMKALNDASMSPARNVK